MADEFLKSCKEGKAQLHSSGFGGTGFKFDASEDNAIKAYKKVGRQLSAPGFGWLPALEPACLSLHSLSIDLT